VEATSIDGCSRDRIVVSGWLLTVRKETKMPKVVLCEAEGAETVESLFDGPSGEEREKEIGIMADKEKTQQHVAEQQKREGLVCDCIQGYSSWRHPSRWGSHACQSPVVFRCIGKHLGPRRSVAGRKSA
jgi:hypothetical protein